MGEPVVRIKKGSQEGTAVYSAFKKVWEPRGWKLADEESKQIAKDEPPRVSGDVKK